jgi:hypothetical protein
MQENGGKLEIISSQTIFDTSNTDIRGQPDWLHITRWLLEKYEKQKFSRNPGGDLSPKKPDWTISRN